jgi:isoleucyl-tRNA synthetase
MYQNLVRAFFKEAPESVHLCDYPEADPARVDRALEERMTLVRLVVSLGNALRSEHKIKNRQPLAAVTVVSPDEGRRRVLKGYEKLILEELNVKSLTVSGDEEAVVRRQVKANFRALGKKFGKETPAAALEIAASGSAEIALFESGKPVTYPSGRVVEASEVEIVRDAKPGTVLATRGGITVLLDTALTPDLVRECHALEFKNRVNTMRKEAGLDKEDRIALFFTTGSRELQSVVLSQFNQFLKSETLALSIEEKEPPPSTHRKSWEVNGQEVLIAIQKIK